MLLGADMCLPVPEGIDVALLDSFVIGRSSGLGDGSVISTQSIVPPRVGCLGDRRCCVARP